jgi:polyhydroxyalkanoate synthesis regulator phasin
VGVGAGLAQQGNGTASTFLAKVAAKLGIGEDKLTTAVDQAYDETLDEAVAAGRLTQEQADSLKARGYNFAPLLGPRFGERLPLGGVRVMDAAAQVLGMSVDDLTAELKGGKSLVDVAAAKGINQEKLTADLLAQVKTQLDGLVSDGKLTQEQADNIYTQTESNIDQIVSGKSGFNFGPRFGGPMQPGGVRVMDAAATVLGMTVNDLMTELKAGKSLVDVAAAKGINQEKLTADLLAQVKTQLDGLVSEGKLTQEQADNIYTQTESNIDQIVSDSSGLGGPCGPHGGRGLGPMSGPSENPTPGGMVQPETGL